MQQRYAAVRSHSLALASRLSAEDQCVQSMPDASPAKWHLAHTSWFFETLLLRPHLPGYRVFDERFGLLFNSYYESLGPRHPRPQRGVLTRPGAEEVLAYRAHVDHAIQALIEQADADTWQVVSPLLELGQAHEQQHQELLLTDIKHAFSLNPLAPAWGTEPALPRREAPAQRWLAFEGGDVEVGCRGGGFRFDNELPRHRVRVHAFELAQRLVSCAEYQAFIDDGGYRRPELWLSDGWALVQAEGWTAPLYWREHGSEAPRLFTLFGEREWRGEEPVCHLSFFEAAAYAEWAQARLPTEFEWETAAGPAAPVPSADDDGALLDPHPRAPDPQASQADSLQQLFGTAWQWTRSSYDPYPGFRPWSGAIGEYNGKFMIGQLVLRGSSCATPAGHSRASYRNFFPPAARWQFAGLRLARDIQRS
jgi:ergothioneine biosynthesis protein EgtB